VSTRRAGLTPANIYTTFPRFLLPTSDSSRTSSLRARIFLRTVSRQTSLTDFTPLDFHDPPLPSLSARAPSRTHPPERLSVLSPLCSAHRAPLQLPLSSANRFKSSGSHRHAHKTRREERKEKRKKKRKKKERRKKETGKRRHTGGGDKKRRKGGAEGRTGRVV